MDADIHTLYSSDFYTIRDFICRCTDCRTSKPEYSPSFCISFVRKGNFIFNVFRHALGAGGGAILGAVINKRNRAVGAVIGGVAGGAVGYGIGRTMDKKDGRY